MSVREVALSKKGTFATMEYERPCKVKKACTQKVVKKTVIRNCRIGAQYDALKSTKEAKGVQTTTEAHALNNGLNGMEWVQYPTLLKSSKTGKQYVRIETNRNTKFETVYTVDGVEVQKADIMDLLLASEKSKGEMPTVLNIGLDTINYIHQVYGYTEHVSVFPQGQFSQKVANKWVVDRYPRPP